MDFAKKLLNKYGWKEGEGLGKNGDGIAKPLKAKLKFDNSGLGADQAASNFNNHWWERVFNEAADNVKVARQENGTIAMELKDSDAVEITTKGYSVKKLKKAKACGSETGAHYENFLQSATLTKAGNEIENPDKIADRDIAVTKFKVLTDEELFRACGGRTAHKGARHGLNLSGKLERLERQEKEMLAKMMESSAKKKESEANDDPKTKSRQKKKTKGIVDEQVETITSVETIATEENSHEVINKKKKKSKRKAEETRKSDEPKEASAVDEAALQETKIKIKKKRIQTV